MIAMLPLPLSLLRNKNLNIHAKIVYGLLCFHGSGTHKCSPSIDILAQETGFHSRTIINCINQLKKLGWIEVHKRFSEKGQQFTNLYIVKKGP
jgi:hypothetical protein